MRDIAEDVEEVEFHGAKCMQRLDSARSAAYCRVRVSRCGATVDRGGCVSRTGGGVPSVAFGCKGAMQGMLLRVEEAVGGGREGVAGW